ncbi:Flp family type IVb pilin [Tautonia sociabilis]|uniref:Flp family type IVb pilin n=1 Tax=Tautonia sociabilis TaxID=2080755 RepID=A0A432MNV3_9BACT|nr:Flp family type IVb pilin [Tautonia sociabilis]RUL88775.1 Flp family type IVb pilin [Tautonia sociabilis]
MIPPRLRRIAADETGATAVEYAMLLAMLILVAIAGINALGGANNAFWQGNIDALAAAIFNANS